jgi:hypothetical protein
MASTPIYNWPTPDNTDLVKNGALAIRTLGDAIDTTVDTMIPETIFAAKGDLLGASANDTPAILAVGANGETLVADSSTSTGLRYNPQNALANPIINGGMDNWQRGTSFSLAASTGTTYVADRWATGTGANQACTISRQATGDTTNLPNIQYALRFQRNSGQTGTGGMSISTSLETVNTIPFAGKTVTMSFYARKGADYASGTFTAFLITGTGTDQNRQSGGYTGDNTSISAAFSSSLTTTWQRFVVTGTIPATATEMSPYLFFDFSGTAGAADYFEVTGFQIDLGTYTASTAPAFRRSGGTIQGELAACQRYYYRTSGTAAYYAMAQGVSDDTTSAKALFQWPVTLRIASTDITYGNLYWEEYQGTASTNPTVTAGGASNNVTRLSLTGMTGLTAGRVGYLFSNNSSTSYIAINAEL